MFQLRRSGVRWSRDVREGFEEDFADLIRLRALRATIKDGIFLRSLPFTRKFYRIQQVLK